MHLLHCTLDYAPRAAGGAERQARLQVEALVARGHTVDVVCPRQGPEGSGVVGGAMVRRLWCARRRRLQTITACASLGWYLLRHGRRYDVVHVHIADLRADVAALVCALIGRPLYVKVAAGGPRGDAGSGSHSHWVRHFGLRHAACVQAISAEISAQLAGLGIAPDRVARIPNGIDQLAYRPVPAAEKRSLRGRLGLPLDRPIALYAGRFARAKGLDRLLAVWPSLAREHDAVLVLAGFVAFEDPYPIPATDGVIVLDWTPDPAPLYHAADLFVLPSRVEGMPNSLLEAMACGLPAVATDVGAAPEMIESERTGILVPTAESEQLPAALGRLLGDAGLRRRLGEAAAASVAGRFSIASVVDRIEARYAQIVTVRRPRASSAEGPT